MKLVHLASKPGRKKKAEQEMAADERYHLTVIVLSLWLPLLRSSNDTEQEE